MNLLLDTTIYATASTDLDTLAATDDRMWADFCNRWAPSPFFVKTGGRSYVEQQR